MLEIIETAGGWLEFSEDRDAIGHGERGRFNGLHGYHDYGAASDPAWRNRTDLLGGQLCFSWFGKHQSGSQRDNYHP